MLLKNIIVGQRSLKSYCDNSAAVSFSNSNSSTGAGLYLDTKYLFVRERVEENKLCIEYISTKLMLADPITKGLPPKHLKNLFQRWASPKTLFKEHKCTCTFLLLLLIKFSHLICLISKYVCMLINI